MAGNAARRLDNEPFPFPEDAEKVWTPDEVAEVLNRLPFVTWDRMIGAPVNDGEHREATVYGWIGRSDEHHDFVTLTFVSWFDKPAFTTSSAARSGEINRLLSGEDAPHFDCLRVEDVLGSLVHRKVVLSS